MIRILDESGLIKISPEPFTTEDYTKMIGLPILNKRWEGRSVIVKPTMAVLRFIRSNWPDAEWESSTHLDRMESFEREEQKTLALKYSDDLPERKNNGYEYKREPRKHQRKALLLSWNKSAFALLMEQRCVDRETEFLTPNGWVKMPDYRQGMKVAQWNEDGNVEFVKPLYYLKVPCDKFIHFKTNRGMDQVLTPDHRMPCYKRSGGKLEVLHAYKIADEFLNKKPGYMHRCFPFAFSMNKFGSGVSLTNDQIRLQVAVMADGSFPSKAPYTNRCVLSIKKKRKIERLRSLLHKTKTTFKERSRPDGFTIFSFQAPLRKKTYDSYFWNCSKDQMSVIREECLFWDGTLVHGKRFFSKHKQDCDFIQMCCSVDGIVSRVSRGNECWEVQIRKQTRGSAFHLGKSKENVKIIPSEDGFAYCFGVPSGYLLLRRNGCIFPTGNCGKTKVIIDNAAYLWKIKRLHTVIIVTLNGVHRNWLDKEVPEDLPDWCPRSTWFIRNPMTKRHRRAFEETFDFNEGLRFFSFNIEGLSSEGVARELFEKTLGDGKGVMLAIDESSDCIKTSSAKRTKYILKIGSKAEFRRILTGTPSPEGKPEEMYSQYKFLNENIFGLDTLTSFRSRYCVTVPMKLGDRGIQNIVVHGCRNVEELRERVDPHSFRVRRDECMDLPPKIYKRWPVELSPKQRKIYNQIRDEYMAEHEGRLLTASLAIVRLTRLQQIVSGWFPTKEMNSEGEVWPDVIPIDAHNPRLSALDDILRTHEGKTIIWSRFRPDLELIQKHLGRRAVSYHGGISNEQKAINYKRFQNDPDIDYFVANQSSAGRGLTLTAATQEIYYSNSLRLVDRLQSEDRPEGDENKKQNTLVIDLEAVGTTDSRTIRLLKTKKGVADLINGDPKKFFMMLQNEDSSD